ncbi:MAG: ATP-binding protein [Candidatus Cryptobacteroides sp.]
MEYLPAIRALCSRGIISLWDTNECDVTSQHFCVPAPVKNCLLDNRLPSTDEMSRVKSRFDRYDLCKRVDSAIQDRQISTLALMQTVSDYEGTNSGMTFVRKVRELVPELPDRVLYYEICYDFYNKHKSDLDDTLEDMNESFGDRFSERRKLLDGTSGLVKAGLLEFSDDYSEVTISDAGQQILLEEDYASYVGGIDCGNRYRFSRMVRNFFHDSEKYDSEQENYLSLVDRLAAKGLSKGIAVLLYGAPGTGKTESVMQWARATGRDVVHIDLSASKSMWYGESEKIVKGIFTRYRNQCKRSKLKPILLFNEADGLFSKRKDISRGSSVDQTENTIQNILLEEMEKLDGILVATTNMADNLDSAFERRFLFKIKLEKPSVEAKRRIWSSKLPALTEEESSILAESFDFSGGEIDNIVRKAVMEEALNGEAPDIESVMRLCWEEKMGGERLRRIGF